MHFSGFRRRENVLWLGQAYGRKDARMMRRIDEDDADMTNTREPTIIKKYANRRLYHTGTSSYVTLEDLSHMVRAGEDFVVTDAKTSEDITRSVLAQIIFEEEAKAGQSLLPISFLRQLIRFYGDSMQSLVPRYLEFSLESLTREQQTFRDQLTTTFAKTPFGETAFSQAAINAVEEQAKANMAMFSDALKMFTPFAQPAATNETTDSEPKKTPATDQSDLDALKSQVADMQARLEKLSR
jgi:polyhydroxyalkanoate synthesis repressor PhaR